MPGKVLTVYVQPDDWTGDEAKRPIKKINVTVENFLDSEFVRGTAAMRSTENNCLLSDLSLNLNLMHVRKGQSSTVSGFRTRPKARSTPIMNR